MATVTLIRAKPAPVVRKFYCCACHRYLTETTATNGTIRVKCEACRKWRLIDVTRRVVT